MAALSEVPHRKQRLLAPVDTSVPATAVDNTEVGGCQQGPDAVCMHCQCLHTALLAQVPQLDGVV